MVSRFPVLGNIKLPDSNLMRLRNPYIIYLGNAFDVDLSRAL